MPPNNKEEIKRLQAEAKRLMTLVMSEKSPSQQKKIKKQINSHWDQIRILKIEDRIDDN
jgi:hypothetical protein